MDKKAFKKILDARDNLFKIAEEQYSDEWLWCLSTSIDTAYCREEWQRLIDAVRRYQNALTEDYG